MEVETTPSTKSHFNSGAGGGRGGEAVKVNKKVMRRICVT